MFHSNTELLIDYWRSLAGDAPPARADVEPSAFAPLAPRAFIAELDHAQLRFRLAGEQLIDLHGRQLAGEPIAQLWRPMCRRRIAGLAEAAFAAGEPLVVAAEAWTHAPSRAQLEILFAPLTGPTGQTDRCLGLYQLVAGKWSGPVGELAIAGAYGVADERPAAHLRLASVDGRRIA